MRNLFIFEGPDYTGKSYALRETAHHFRELFGKEKVKLFKFPNYTGEGLDLSEKNPYMLKNGQLAAGKILYDMLHNRKYNSVTKTYKEKKYDFNNPTTFVNFHYLQLLDKEQTADYLLSCCDTHKLVLCDRFIDSQIVYASVFYEMNNRFYNITESDEYKLAIKRLDGIFKNRSAYIGFSRTKSNHLFQLVKRIEPKDDRDTNTFDMLDDTFHNLINNAYEKRYLLKKEPLFIADQNQKLFDYLFNKYNSNIFDERVESYYFFDEVKRIKTLLEKTSSINDIIDFITRTGGF